MSPFLPTDSMLTAKAWQRFPTRNGSDKAKQVGFEGLYLPTAKWAGRCIRQEELRDQVLLKLT
ncbi:MAG TPA: hypothetical protein DGG94_16965 [Micromonosporaceae bacterium]|nr:hypothetical protein [Micromonosporaceae bacterium]